MSHGGMSASSNGRQDRFRSHLQRIADALGTTPEALIEGAKDETYGDDTAELVRLWFKITDADHRRLILEQVRKLAENG